MNIELIEKSYMTRSTKGNPRKIITQMVPKFDWEKFKLLPNAADFVAKFFDQCTTQMMREIDEQKNGTAADHLASMETVVARVLTYSAKEIEDWCDSRDWGKAGIDPQKANNIKKHLMEFGARKGGVNAECGLSTERRKTLAQRVMLVAEKDDPLADWLFTRLTTPRLDDGQGSDSI